MKLKDRIDSYQESSDYKLLNRVPIIISINGRAFSKTTSLLEKPYCAKMSECMISTMLYLCTELEGAIFAYQYNDEMVFVLRNDQSPETSPWFDNKIQKICSLTASLATVQFNVRAASLGLNFIGDAPVFTSQVFVVPNVAEAINTLIYKQQHNFHLSMQFACFYELLKKGHDKNTIKEMLTGLTMDDKIEMLTQECNVDFNDYESAFRRGTACYKIPKIVDGTMKNKWCVNSELPIFAKEQHFLSNIFKNGADIFRQENL